MKRDTQQALEQDHRITVNKMKEGFKATAEQYKSEIAALKAGAQRTGDETKHTIDVMRKDLDQAKSDKEKAQEESREFRSMLSALQREVDAMKGFANRTSEGEVTPQVSHSRKKRSSTTQACVSL